MIVIDTSVALQWVLSEPDALASEQFLGRSDMIAPDILVVEAANVLSRKVRKDQIGERQAYEGLALISALFPHLVASRDLAKRAMDLSIQLAHPAYDCLFLACAERNKATLVTRDLPLIRRANEAGFGEWIRPVSEFRDDA